MTDYFVTQRLEGERTIRAKLGAANLLYQTIGPDIAQAKVIISVITFNNYVKDLNSVFTFAVRAGYCERNPFDGLKVKLKVKVSSLRSRFTTNDDVNTILFTDIHTHNEKAPKDYQYWLPLLGLYTGARLNELSQLYRSSIVVVNGIGCLNILAVNSGQRLKSPSSERLYRTEERTTYPALRVC